jgi:predicted nucleic acid-binding protein
VIVVDSNVIAYLYLPGEHTAAAEALMQRESKWAAPLLWRSEVRNVLAGYLRRGTLSFEQTLAIQSEAEDLLRGGEYEVSSAAVLELVAASDCTAYDCEFVAVARHLGTRLVTMDAKLLKAFPKDAQALSEA